MMTSFASGLLQCCKDLRGKNSYPGLFFPWKRKFLSSADAPSWKAPKQMKWMDRKQAAPIILACFNIGLVGSLLMMGLYVIAAILGGIDCVYGIAAFASLAVWAALSKRILKQSIVRGHVKLIEILILALSSSFFILLWTAYPLNIAWIALVLLGCACSYRAMEKP